MITVHAQLKDKAGKELDAQDAHAYTYPSAMLAAVEWGKGVLRRTDDPDAYVQYTCTMSKARR